MMKLCWEDVSNVTLEFEAVTRVNLGEGHGWTALVEGDEEFQ